MAERIRISTGTHWENFVGYSRALRVGNLIEVSGTVAADQEGQVVGAGDPYAQTRFILSKIEKALIEAGGSLEAVVRTRLYVTNIAEHWEPIARAHGEVFGTLRPASTMVEIGALVDPEYLIEIEAQAILDPDSHG